MFHRGQVEEFCRLSAELLGASSEDAALLVTNQGSQVGIQRGVDDSNNEVVDVTFSQEVDVQFLSPDATPPATRMAMTIRIPIAELDNGTPENFTIINPPHLEQVHYN